MSDLKKEIETSIIFITHDLGVIAEIADRVIVMHKGVIVEEGSVVDIFENPKHPYTKGLLACRPPLDKRLKILPTVLDFMKIDENGQMIELEGGASIKEKIEQVIVTEQETIERRAQLEKAPNLLEIKNLKVWFPSKLNFFGKPLEYVKAVDDVSITMKEGETLGLVGESGCGKTTMGKTILRLNPATDGEIIYKGRDILSLSKADMKDMRREMQIIFQDPYSSLNPRMTVGDAIMEPMMVHGILANDKERKDKALELLSKVNLLPEQFFRYPHEFSGGQRQRICIARALALNPKFIICDESVSALDVSVQAQVLNLLISLREEFKFSYIFISHDLSVVKFISDRIAVMNKGKLEELGYADDIYNNPQTEYTQRLIAAIPKGDIQEIKQKGGFLNS
jgi:peptide/nickel transport system ATP-binding protein